MGSNLAKSNLVKAAAVDFGIQWACWAVAATLKTEKFYDLAGKVQPVYLQVKIWVNIHIYILELITYA